MKTNPGMSRGNFVSGLLASMAILLSGCNQQNIVDRITMINILGIDSREELIVGNAIYPDYEHKEKLKFTQGIGRTTQLVFGDMQMHETKPLKLGKLRMLIFSKELAEKGVIRFIHSICRDPLINSYVILAVSEQPTEVLLKHLEKQGIEMLPNRLIVQNEKAGNVPKTNLHTFLFDYYGDGRDVFMPYVGLGDNGVFEVKGIAAFREDKLALVLNEPESVALKLLQPEFKNGFIPVQFGKAKKGYPGVLMIVSGGNDMKMTKAGDGTTITFHTKVYGYLKDQEERIDIREQMDFENIEREVENDINLKMQATLLKLQAKGVDPLGIGDFVRAHDRGWKESEFYSRVYPRLKLKVESKVKLKESSIGN